MRQMPTTKMAKCGIDVRRIINMLRTMTDANFERRKQLHIEKLIDSEYPEHSIQNAVSNIKKTKVQEKLKSKAGGHRILLDIQEFIVALCVTQFVLSLKP